jgi:hypothetical protein
VAFNSFGKHGDDQPDRRAEPRNPLIEALEEVHEEALKGNLSGAEYGRRVTEALSGASREDIAEATAYLSQEIGQAPPEDARLAAIERLTEMRAAGKISKENFERERKRISEY